MKKPSNYIKSTIELIGMTVFTLLIFYSPKLMQYFGQMMGG